MRTCIEICLFIFVFNSILAYTSPNLFIHLNIQPHVVWDPTISNEYLDLLQQMSVKAKTVNATMVVDIPYWFADLMIPRDGSVKPLNQLVSDVAGKIGIMDGRDWGKVKRQDDPDLVTLFSAQIIQYAQSQGKQFMVALHIGCGVMPNSLTLCDNSTTQLEKRIEELHKFYSQFNNFDSLAIDSADLWQWMQVDSGTSVISKWASSRDVYEWNPSVITDQNERKLFFEFATSHSVRRVYVDVQTALVLSQWNELFSFYSEATVYGLDVEFLLGKRWWVLQSNHGEALTVMDALIQFIQMKLQTPTRNAPPLYRRQGTDAGTTTGTGATIVLPISSSEIAATSTSTSTSTSTTTTTTTSTSTSASATSTSSSAAAAASSSSSSFSSLPLSTSTSGSVGLTTISISTEQTLPETSAVTSSDSGAPGFSTTTTTTTTTSTSTSQPTRIFAPGSTTESRTYTTVSTENKSRNDLIIMVSVIGAVIIILIVGITIAFLKKRHDEY